MSTKQPEKAESGRSASAKPTTPAKAKTPAGTPSLPADAPVKTKKGEQPGFDGQQGYGGTGSSYKPPDAGIATATETDGDED